jgi:hypothetical protein
MAEGVGVAGLVDGQDVAGDRLAQQPHQLLGVLADHLGQQLVVHPGAGHRGHLQHPLGRLRQRLHPGQDQLPQHRRQPGPVQVGGHQLLGEERVALRAGQHLPDQRRRGRLAQDPGQQPGHVPAAQPAQLQPLGPAAAVQLGQERPQRMAAVQLVGPVGEHQGDPAAQVADQEAEQVAGGLVGPVQVLHHHQQRAGLGEAVQDPEQQLEQPRRGQRGRRRRAPGRGRGAELGHQPGQLGPGAAQHPLQLRRLGDAGQRAQRLHQRGVRQDALPDVQAATGERDRAPPGGLAEQLGDQPGLADAGLARHHHGGGPAGRRQLEGRPELGDLGVAADQNRTGDSAGHAADHGRCRHRGQAPAGRGWRTRRRRQTLRRRRVAGRRPARASRARRSAAARWWSSVMCWMTISWGDTRYISSSSRYVRSRTRIGLRPHPAHGDDALLQPGRLLISSRVAAPP